MLRVIIYLFLLLIFGSCGGGEQRHVSKSRIPDRDERIELKFLDTVKTIPIILKALSNSSCVNARHIGFVGNTEDITYLYAEKLCSIASDDELLQVTLNRNPVVAIYSFRCLLLRKSPAIKQALKNLRLNDALVCERGRI